MVAGSQSARTNHIPRPPLDPPPLKPSAVRTRFLAGAQPAGRVPLGNTDPSLSLSACDRLRDIYFILSELCSDCSLYLDLPPLMQRVVQFMVLLSLSS